MRKNTNPVSSGHQPKAGIVLSEDESALCTARKHAVWFVRALGHEIIYQNANVGILTTEDKRLFTSN